MLNVAGRYDLDPDTATIRCLPHVMHLAISDLFVILKVVKKTNMREDDLDVGNLTEEMAEEIGNDLFSVDSKDDEIVLREQAREGEEIDASVFAKVSCHVSQCCHYASLVKQPAARYCQAYTLILPTQRGLV